MDYTVTPLLTYTITSLEILLKSSAILLLICICIMYNTYYYCVVEHFTICNASIHILLL